MAKQFPPEEIEHACSKLKEKLAVGKTAAEAKRQLLEAKDPWSNPIPEPLLDAALDKLRKERELPPTSVVSLVNKQQRDAPWIDDSAIQNGKFWPPLRDLYKSKRPEAVDSIDASSGLILSSLRPPATDTYHTKGLVLGYVQSGKTTNFTSVLAKAADAGYRFFIILSGITNNLRYQTQKRLEEELIQEKEAWIWLTTLENDFDSSQNQNATTFLSTRDKKIIAVVKKNSTVLSKLNKFIQSASLAASKCPILVIDDEADQASINIGNREKEEQSAINNHIAALLRNNKTAYIAYTATPFANLLINPNQQDDLYPKDFIHVLPKPAGYYGTESIFGREPLSGDDEDGFDGLPVVKMIPDHEVQALQPRSKQTEDEWELYVPNSLVEALRWFFLATAVRKLRGQANEHSSMLIHTTVRTLAHDAIKELIEQEIRGFRNELNDPARLQTWKELWDEESQVFTDDKENLAENYPELVNLPQHTFEEILPKLKEALNEVKTVTDNSTSDERLHYSDDTPLTVIAIGGNPLSRGLTLEGLVSSYFVRNSSAYDTLLQMGRWFGFRNGYADLPRIWMSEDLLGWFRDLAGVEADLRQELAIYQSQNLTPLDYQARIRKHPYLEITSRAKAQELREVSLSYSGQRVQTILFKHDDKDWLTSNLESTRRLVDNLSQAVADPFRKPNGTWVYRGVPTDIVLDFLKEYSFHEDSVLGRDAGKKLRGYIESERDSSIKQWSISFFGRSSEAEYGSIDLGLPRPISLISRSQVSDSRSAANIKSLVGSLDRLNDVESLSEERRAKIDEQVKSGSPTRDQVLIDVHDDLVGPDVAHLAIYAISKDSQPKAKNATRSAKRPTRKPLNAAEHVIGVGIFFPNTSRIDNSYDYVSAIEPDQAVFEAYEEDYEETQVRISDETES